MDLVDEKDVALLQRGEQRRERTLVLDCWKRWSRELAAQLGAMTASKGSFCRGLRAHASACESSCQPPRLGGVTAHGGLRSPRSVDEVVEAQRR